MTGRMLIARIAQIAVLALVLALPFALARSWIDARHFATLRDVLPHVLVRSVDISLVVAAATIVLWTTVFRTLSGRRGARVAARIASVTAFAPAAYFTAYRINHDLLPGITEPTSLVANAVLLPALVVFGYFVHRHLLHWQQEAWRTGRVPFVPLALLASLPVGAHVCAGRPRDPAPDVLVLTIDIFGSCWGISRRSCSPTRSA